MRPWNPGRTTTVILFTLTIAQAVGAQRSEPLPLRPLRHTLDKPPRSKNKNKPRTPREEPPNGNELPSVVRAVSTPGVPLVKGMACGHGNVIVLLPYPGEVVLPEGSTIGEGRKASENPHQSIRHGRPGRGYPILNSVQRENQQCSTIREGEDAHHGSLQWHN